MMRNTFRKHLPLRILLGAFVLLAYATPGSAVLGVRRRTAVVAYSAGEAKASSQAAAQQSAAAQQQAAAQQTAAAQQSAAAAAQASASAEAASKAAAEASQAAAHPAAPQKTPQQQLQELQSLYNQKLISQSEYEAAKKKILDAMTK